jgi:hypothetical protein
VFLGAVRRDADRSPLRNDVTAAARLRTDPLRIACFRAFGCVGTLLEMGRSVPEHDDQPTKEDDMTFRRLAQSLAAACLGLALAAAPTIAVAAPATPPAAAAPAPRATHEASAARGASDASDEAADRYAAREAAAPQAAGFKGQGAGIYIGGSTLAVVLVIVLVVVLL